MAKNDGGPAFPQMLGDNPMLQMTDGKVTVVGGAGQMNIGRYGVEIGNMQLINTHEDACGRWFIVKGQRQEVSIFVTPSGLVRVSKPRKTHPSVNCFEKKK